MGFDFNSILNNNIDNTYIDNVQWNLRIDNLFYICKTVKYKDVDGNLYNTEITKDKFNNIEIKYTDINENYEFILQFINENQNQIVPYIEVIDLYNNHINNEDIAEQICNFLTTLFNTIKEQSLIHINRNSILLNKRVMIQFTVNLIHGFIILLIYKISMKIILIVILYLHSWVLYIH